MQVRGNADGARPLTSHEVVIASNGTPMVRLVPIGRKGRLAGWGKLKQSY